MTNHPDHELEVLEEDQTVPPRPEENIADVRGDSEKAGTAGPSEPTDAP
ncbi:hypothetical protein GCM10023258_14950 [Terrabacter aeriphilus]|uniref:Uncharacterized protein n=1 Tax=Terrabacter aeriphilus TaxID=515662 RepID=A0ABP9J8K0_9MICO